jgi:DnaJ-class molecular chaperone
MEDFDYYDDRPTKEELDREEMADVEYDPDCPYCEGTGEGYMQPRCSSCKGTGIKAQK